MCAFNNAHPKRRRNSSYSDDAVGRTLEASWSVVEATVAATGSNCRWLFLRMLPCLDDAVGRRLETSLRVVGAAVAVTGGDQR